MHLFSMPVKTWLLKKMKMWRIEEVRIGGIGDKSS